MSKLNMPVASHATGSYYQSSLDLTLTTDSYPVPVETTVAIAIASMQTARDSGSSFVIDGKGYVAGGSNGSTVVNTVEK